MIFHIMTKDNHPVLQGDLVLMRPHSSVSLVQHKQAYLVYMHNVITDNVYFKKWADKHLIHNHASGSGGIKATSNYDYIEFTSGEFMNDYDFMIAETPNPFFNQTTNQGL